MFKPPKSDEKTPFTVEKKIDLIPFSGDLLSAGLKMKYQPGSILKKKLKRKTGMNQFSPQPGKKFFTMNTLNDQIDNTESQLTQTIVQRQSDLDSLQVKLKEMEENVEKKTMMLNTIELKLYKVEKDIAKSSKDLEETEKSIKHKTDELLEFSKKEYELHIV